MRVSAGYLGQYRTDAWVPVRVTLRNTTGSDIRGTVEIPDSLSPNGSGGFQGPPQPYSARYEMAVVLPAGAQKRVTLYVPGSDINGEVDVRLRSGSRTLASGYAQPNTFADGDLSVGVVTADPINTAWLHRVNSDVLTLDVARLAPASLDALPQALTNFDIIAITNVDASRLDREQTGALQQYVRGGGSLLLIGGPDWQETLHPLRAALVPGRLIGSRTLPNLAGLASLGQGDPPRQPAAVAALDRPRGEVLAAENGTPLVVRQVMGNGRVIFLAFDPGVAPIAHWRRASDLLRSVVGATAPVALSRSAWPNGFQPPSAFNNPFGPPADISLELSNVPAAALPSIVLFLILTGLYVLLLGPGNFILLRRLRRRELGWLTVPLLGLLCVAVTFGVAFRLKGNAVLLNTVSLVQLDGSGEMHPASLYVGLFAPVRGDYQLAYSGQSLPAAVPQYYYSGPAPQSHPLGLRFQEGGQTAVTFTSMNMWSMRDVELNTQVRIPGAVRTDLWLDSRGSIVGSVRNDTRMTLVRPTIFAGRSFAHLADLAPGATARVHVRPSYDIHNHYSPPVWYQAFGQPQYGGPYFGQKAFFGISQGTFIPYRGPGPSYCCPEPTPPQEKTLRQRIRNTANLLPAAQLTTSASEVTLVAWSEQRLGTLTVDGTTPARRDLDLLVMPLTVRFPRGAFTLRAGTLGAALVNDYPQAPLNGCCPRPMGPQPVFLGPGGWATFDWTIPNAGHIHFQRLTISVDAGGAAGRHIGHVYDWRAQRWVPINLQYGDARLTDPDRFISPSGVVLLKLQATDNSRDIGITDPRQALQISGRGVVT